MHVVAGTPRSYWTVGQRRSFLESLAGLPSFFLQRLRDEMLGVFLLCEFKALASESEALFLESELFLPACVLSRFLANSAQLIEGAVMRALGLRLVAVE